MAFNMSEYQTVQERIDLFWERYPQGRFNVEIISLTESQVVMKAEVWTDWAEDAPRAVDYAEERPTKTGVNATSFIENCSTSCLGRAISQLGGNLSPKGKKPSREEMQKVERINQTGFIATADSLAAAKDLDGLRKLYASAQTAGANPETLKGISDRANGLKTAPDIKG